MRRNYAKEVIRMRKILEKFSNCYPLKIKQNSIVALCGKIITQKIRRNNQPPPSEDKRIIRIQQNERVIPKILSNNHLCA